MGGHKNSGLPDHFWIRNVIIWNNTGVNSSPQDVEILGGVIDKITPAQNSVSLGPLDIDGKGRVLMPSGVDPQVHLRVPGQGHKERPETGLRAALRGGVGALLTMPNTQPVIDSPEVLAEARSQVIAAENATGVRVLFSAAMTEGQRGEFAVSGPELAQAGVVALTDDGRGVAREDVMKAVFEQAALSGLPLLQHAEVPGHGGVVAPSTLQKKLGLAAYPDSAEIDMVKRDLEILKNFPEVRYHVLHVSLSQTVEWVQKARALGLKASCEVSPHHLIFSSEDLVEGNTSFKMNPPLRAPKERDELQNLLSSGAIDFVATDHAPHEEKGKGEDFRSSYFGTTGLETSLRVLFTLMAQGKLSEERLVEVFSTAPARFLGIDNEFGSVQPGRPLRALLVDPHAPARPVVQGDLESLSKNNVFLGFPLAGRIFLHFNSAGLFRLEQDPNPN